MDGIWNPGCLTYEMATSRSLFLPVAGVSDELGQLSRHFKHTTERVLLEALVVFTLTEAEGHPTNLNISFEEMALFAHFVAETLCLKPDKRGTVSELLSHPWLEDVLMRTASKFEEKLSNRLAVGLRLAEKRVHLAPMAKNRSHIHLKLHVRIKSDERVQVS
ncbi:hypothetical protein DFH29DRAFT_45700 [Suillus ampliporus]|nr:hypothetical protein DFH29DRAFT_45700 [Suillus ampliporus]